MIPATGYVDQHIEKGYAFLHTAPDRLVDSLDNMYGLGDGLAYRHIDGPWHLYYYNRDAMSGPCSLDA